MDICVMTLEPLDTRYTGEWYKELPDRLRACLNTLCPNEEHNVLSFLGNIENTDVTPGAFINFFYTNVYKSTQLVELLYHVRNSPSKDTVVLFPDAWNPAVIQLRYTVGLLNLPIKIAGMWHAGSYDKNDFLGRAFGNTCDSWSFDFERSLYKALDINYFATDYHKSLFERSLSVSGKSAVVGWPLEYLPANLFETHKENCVVFPHRLSVEKKPEVLDTLAAANPDIEFIKTQETPLTKNQYHGLLAKSKVVFSASLQETLGIGIYEGMLSGCLPLVPYRLSYVDIFYHLFPDPQVRELFTYMDSDDPSLQSKLRYLIENYDTCLPILKEGLEKTNNLARYYSGSSLYQSLYNL